MILILQNKLIIDYDSEIEIDKNNYIHLKNKKYSFPDWLVQTQETAEDLPSDFVPRKYIFDKKKIKTNPDYVEPSPFDNPDYAAGYEQALLDILEEA